MNIRHSSNFPYFIHPFIVFCYRCFLCQHGKQKERQGAIMLILNITTGVSQFFGGGNMQRIEIRWNNYHR
jgi:hypothetical protein